MSPGIHLTVTCFFFFFFNDTATTEIYTLSLHDALPISHSRTKARRNLIVAGFLISTVFMVPVLLIHDLTAIVLSLRDRKSTRLNSSHANISYAVFCLKKKQTNMQYGSLNNLTLSLCISQ